MNPLINLLGSNAIPPNMRNMINQFQQFKQTFSGDPKQQIQMMMNSGRISQDQYNKAVQMANELVKFLK